MTQSQDQPRRDRKVHQQQDVEPERRDAVRGEPELADPREHRDEHQDVEHDRRDDRDEADDIHRPDLRDGRPRGDPVDDEPEDDQQQHVEHGQQVAVEVASDPGDQVDDRRDHEHHARTAA